MKAPKIPSFFKLNQNKSFEYKPLYYNESKERIKKISRNSETTIQPIDKDIHKTKIREKIQEKWKRNSYKKGAEQANSRVLIIILILLALVYYIFS